MTRSHSSDRHISAGSGWLRAYGMCGMNRCDMLVVCTDVTATYGASGIEGQHMWCGRGMIGMRRCLQCLECGCKVWYVQMSPDVVLECQECGWGLVDSCMTTGHWFYSYSRYLPLHISILSCSSTVVKLLKS